jgi:hypothetical protein
MTSDTLATYTTTIGDGRSTQFTITHRLHCATPMVTVYDKDLNLVRAVVTVTGLESVCVDTGTYLGVDNHYRLGPFKFPRLRPKLLVAGPTIPAPASLHVQVVA